MMRFSLLLLSTLCCIGFYSCEDNTTPPACDNIIYEDTTTLFLSLDNVCYVQGITYQLLPPGFGNPTNTFLWSNGSTDAIIYTGFPGSFIVNVTDTGGTTTNYSVFLNPECTDFYIPTAFTPNGDGHNDTWIPIYTDVCHASLEILNSDGHSVFTTKEPELGWNGKLDEQFLPTGVYYYFLDIRLNSGEATYYEGSIQLLY